MQNRSAKTKKSAVRLLQGGKIPPEKFWGNPFNWSHRTIERTTELRLVSFLTNITMIRNEYNYMKVNRLVQAL